MADVIGQIAERLSGGNYVFVDLPFIRIIGLQIGFEHIEALPPDKIFLVPRKGAAAHIKRGVAVLRVGLPKPVGRRLGKILQATLARLYLLLGALGIGDVVQAAEYRLFAVKLHQARGHHRHHDGAVGLFDTKLEVGVEAVLV